MEIRKFIIMCLSISLWILCGYCIKYKDYSKEEIFITALTACIFDFFSTFNLIG